MSGWTKKTVLARCDSGAKLRLALRCIWMTGPLKRRQKQIFIVPKRSLADAVATEWQAQVDVVKPDEMPFTRDR